MMGKPPTSIYVTLAKHLLSMLWLSLFTSHSHAAETTEWRFVLQATEGRVYIDMNSLKTSKGITRGRYLVKFKVMRSYSNHGAYMEARSSITDFQVKCGRHEMRTRAIEFFSDPDGKGNAGYGVEPPDVGMPADIAWFEPVKDGSKEDVIYDSVCETNGVLE